jgi:acyl-coenzyme A thioesterase PaaI-like protein
VAEPYPPDRHVLRDLRLWVETGPGPVVRGDVAIVDELRTGSGLPHPGALALVVDVLGGGLAAVAASPDWIATADLTLHLLPVEADDVVARGRVLRRGRTTVVLEVDLATGAGDALGLATLGFAVLPRRDDNPVIAPEDEDFVRRVTLARPDSAMPGPFERAAGITRTDGHTATCVVSDYVRNSLGALQGGVMAATALAAADEALAGDGGEAAVVDLQVQYLALGRVGPVVAHASPVADGDALRAEVVVADRGRDGAPVTTRARVAGVRL